MAILFIDLVGKIHGMTQSGITLRMSSAYHPQSDGQTEVATWVVEQYLWAFVHQWPATWGRFLPWGEWSYNMSQHEGTSLSSFEFTFGKKSPMIPQYIVGSYKVEIVDDLFSNCELMFSSL